MISRRIFIASGGALLLATRTAVAQPALIVRCAAALRSTVEPLIADFEKSHGVKVSAEYGIINEITERLRKDDIADLAIVSSQQWEQLNKEGKLDPHIRTVVAKLGYGLFVKGWSAKPDIGSVEALKAILLNAHSITMPSGPPTGPIRSYETRLFEQLGVATELAPKLKYNAPGSRVAGLFQLVASGDAEIGIATTAEILEGAGVDFVGAVPDPVQSFIVFTTAIPKTAKAPILAKAFIGRLTSAESASLLKSRGFEPG